MSVPSWCRVGAKCICIDDGVHEEWLSPHIKYRDGLDGLTKGEIYTVRDTFFDEIEQSWRVRLVEIVRGTFMGIEDGYVSFRFRPLVSLEDDIATHFEHHLHNDHRAPETVA